MKLKNGVSLYGLHPKMQVANGIAAVIYQEAGQELVVTAGLDGKHGDNSLHYKGRACDYRTWYFSDEQKKEVVQELARRLGDDYDVVLEATHIHCEYDPTNPKVI